MASPTEKELRYSNSDGLVLSAMIRLAVPPTIAKPRGDVLLIHGLNNDKDEDGSFVKLSEILSQNSYNVMRFDFRAHGDSQGETKDVTIQGELNDLVSSIKRFDSLLESKSSYILVASSFGASASIIYASQQPDRVNRLVLWNPVLDYEKTFLKAETPWGRTFFNKKGYRDLEQRGYVQIPNTDFKIGRALVQEFRTLKPYALLSKLQIPVLTIHGTKDTSVPFSVSEKYGKPNARSLFISHPCDHQFIGMEDKVISETVSWIVNSN